jgi:hypothetical protein
MTDETKKDLRKQLEFALADVKSMAGDLGEKLGKTALEASAEARERWKKLEPKVKEKLKAADDEISGLSETAGDQLKGIYGELKSSFSLLRERFVGGATASGDAPDGDGDEPEGAPDGAPESKDSEGTP